MSGIKKVFITDKGYPKNLKHIYDPPSPIYVKGDIIPEDDVAVALVGSRRASIYGLNTCEKLAYEMAARGITVISGLARGIDSAAHKGALKAGGRTVAVFGCGLDCIYPPENRSLAEKIQKDGVLVSEFPAETPPLAGNFPQRNRIISGLALGVVVVEAARNSGALITANFALEQGREVFAVPGKVDSAASAGVHRLIKEGAKLVEGVEDIIEELNLKPQKGETFQNTLSVTRKVSPKLKEVESRVYLILSDEPKYIDDITKDSGLSSGEVLNILLKLQLKKLVKELPGKLYYR